MLRACKRLPTPVTFLLISTSRILGRNITNLENVSIANTTFVMPNVAQNGVLFAHHEQLPVVTVTVLTSFLVEHTWIAYRQTTCIVVVSMDPCSVQCLYQSELNVSMTATALNKASGTACILSLRYMISKSNACNLKANWAAILCFSCLCSSVKWLDITVNFWPPLYTAQMASPWTAEICQNVSLKPIDDNKHLGFVVRLEMAFKFGSGNDIRKIQWFKF